MLYNTLESARSLKQEMFEVARAFRTTKLRLWFDALMLPRFGLAFQSRPNRVLWRYFPWYRCDEKAGQ